MIRIRSPKKSQLDPLNQPNEIKYRPKIFLSLFDVQRVKIWEKIYPDVETETGYGVYPDGTARSGANSFLLQKQDIYIRKLFESGQLMVLN